ncbi:MULTISPECIES: PTS sugar transporter subunit IIA [Aerococcus]|uniref:PTS sugar transporter subunit IIA n=1 Tax=Aerococcus TaxID=1375 RepID=UPI000DCE6706|nr:MULTISPECIES: PTS sugar transporter subunit IIA [Aerococcus]KAA9297494.1 PTS sugar transporter subunit IIA [Aerococcus tenax]MDK6688157.1 PTS sugar transporter subunit IIA [Aerococcus urinae]MDK8132723.1 PTS sugar transporter subunit IIA [Aerococcus urinae]MDK8484357.1 PTS sugar transporter subunit IIA [Aerococcus urinae]MDL5179361.1 PTS sugar transporter subunit IIA [Aerococcus tenax]
MLKYFYEKGLINYPEDQPKDWEEAVRVSCDKLIEKNLITNDYVDAIVQSVKDNGPYIVIVPGIAMPHAQAENPGVLGTGISFTKYKEPVTFHDEKTGEDHYAELFFTLAAKDPDEHLQNIQNLMELLMDEDIVEKLKATNSIEDYKKLL